MPAAALDAITGPRDEGNPAQERIIAFLLETGLIGSASGVAFSLLSGGNSHITWRLRLNAAGQGDLVVKVAQPDGPLAPYDVAHEAAMMRAARAAGAAAPELVGFAVSDQGDCDFLVMKHVAGEAPAIWEVAKWLGDADPAFRRAVGGNLIAALGPLRSLASAADQNLPALYDAYLHKAEAEVRAAAEDLFPLPETVAKVGAWLRNVAADLDGPPALYHGDFRVGNAVFQGAELAALLDWERAMVGHPMHDIGYLCLPAMKSEGLICGLFTADGLADIYEEEIGEPFDAKLCGYFRIMSMYTEFCAMVRALGRLAKGHGRINGARTLPLVARLHHDMLVAIREWNDGRFHL